MAVMMNGVKVDSSVLIIRLQYQRHNESKVEEITE